MNQSSLRYKTIERVIYRNGQITESIPTLVERQFKNSLYGEVSMMLMMRRASEEFKREYNKIVREHAYPIFGHEGQSYQCQIYFKYFKQLSGEHGIDIISANLEELIRKLNELRNKKDANKRTTVLLRIKTTRLEQ